ncbi:MAG: GGDEF domain-containing protein [Pseudomonadota bacterium]
MSISPFRSARWSHRAQHAVTALGPLVCTMLLTALVALIALVVTHAGLTLAGGGDRLLASAGALLCALLITPPIAWPLLRLVCELEAARAQLDVLATRDELTGVHNRRQFLVLADREWSRCRRYDMAAALLMVDVDLFKRVNDENGHLAGDLMLREIARAAGDTLRQPDLLGRFGGEEFVVFLPHADPLGALDAAERIRERVAQLSLEWKGQVIRATVSVGVAALDASHDSLASLIQDADQALYAAKDAGRNCVRTLPDLPRRSGESYPALSR